MTEQYEAGPELDRLIVRRATKHPMVEFSGVKFYLQKQGYFTSPLTGVRLHRAIWEKFNGPIKRGFVIHHRDGNKANNSIENLQLVDWGKHTAMHNREHRRLPIRPATYCSECGCNRQAKARSLCTKHYQRLMAKINGGWPRWVTKND